MVWCKVHLPDVQAAVHWQAAAHRHAAAHWQAAVHWQAAELTGCWTLTGSWTDRLLNHDRLLNGQAAEPWQAAELTVCCPLTGCWTYSLLPTDRLLNLQAAEHWQAAELTGCCSLTGCWTNRLLLTDRLMNSDRLLLTDRLLFIDRLLNSQAAAPWQAAAAVGPEWIHQERLPSLCARSGVCLFDWCQAPVRPYSLSTWVTTWGQMALFHIDIFQSSLLSGSRPHGPHLDRGSSLRSHSGPRESSLCCFLFNVWLKFGHTLKANCKVGRSIAMVHRELPAEQ